MEVFNSLYLSSEYKEKGIEQNKIEVVKRLYDKNFTSEDIAEIVDMKVEDVLKLSE